MTAEVPVEQVVVVVVGVVLILRPGVVVAPSFPPPGPFFTSIRLLRRSWGEWRLSRIEEESAEEGQ